MRVYLSKDELEFVIRSVGLALDANGVAYGKEKLPVPHLGIQFGRTLHSKLMQIQDFPPRATDPTPAATDPQR